MKAWIYGRKPRKKVFLFLINRKKIPFPEKKIPQDGLWGKYQRGNLIEYPKLIK